MLKFLFIKSSDREWSRHPLCFANNAAKIKLVNAPPPLKEIRGVGGEGADELWIDPNLVPMIPSLPFLCLLRNEVGWILAYLCRILKIYAIAI